MTTPSKLANRGHVSLRGRTADALRRYAVRNRRSMSSVIEEVLGDLPPAPSEIARGCTPQVDEIHGSVDFGQPGVN